MTDTQRRLFNPYAPQTFTDKERRDFDEEQHVTRFADFRSQRASAPLKASRSPRTYFCL